MDVWIIAEDRGSRFRVRDLQAQGFRLRLSGSDLWFQCQVLVVACIRVFLCGGMAQARMVERLYPWRHCPHVNNRGFNTGRLLVSSRCGAWVLHVSYLSSVFFKLSM